MIPIEIEPQNFLAYRNPGPLRFEGIQIACLAGPNGAGKSSLLDAITWALWGKARSNSPDELIHQIHDAGISGSSQDMRVSFTFRQGGQTYRVIRQRKTGKRGSSVLEFQIYNDSKSAWQPLSEATMRVTQKKIDELIRLDYETFINSALLVQGRADEFTMKTPAQRKQVLSNILALSRWDGYEERTKEKIRQVRGELQRLDGRIEEIDRELALEETYHNELEIVEQRAKEIGKNLEEAEKVWSNLQGTRAELVSLQRGIDDATRRITSLEREIEEAEQERKLLTPRSNREGIQASLDQVQKSLRVLEPSEKELEGVKKRIAEIAEKTAHLKGINAALGPETEPLKVRVEVLGDSHDPSCPTCGQPLTEEHRKEVIEELQKEIDQRRVSYRENRDQIDDLDVEIKQLMEEEKDLQKACSARPELEKEQTELVVMLSHVEEVEKQLGGLAKRIDRWGTEVDEEQMSRSKLEHEVELAESRLQASTLTQSDVDALRAEKRLADERVGGARQKVNALQSYKEQRGILSQERDEQSRELGAFEDLREAFGKGGVPAMIIETVVPELERSANDLLHRLTDGRMNIRIETQREIKSGEVREALDIIIADELGSRPYELYSGGEAFRINFAIRIALSKLLARRAGSELRSLFIDEGFGTQDARGREHLVAAINTIQDDFDLIIVITHIDELKDAFPTRIEVEKTPSGSQYRLT